MIRARSASNRGFSLVELMVVVAMVGIMAGLAVPQISASSRRANAAVPALRVHGFTSEARNLARRTNRCVKVDRSTDGTSLTASTFSTCALTEVCRCRASALPDATMTLVMADGIPRDGTVGAFTGNVTTAAFASVATSGDGIVFLADGSTPYAGAVTISVSVPLDTGARDYTLRVMPATGIVRLLQAGE